MQFSEDDHNALNKNIIAFKVNLFGETQLSNALQQFLVIARSSHSSNI